MNRDEFRNLLRRIAAEFWPGVELRWPAAWELPRSVPLPERLPASGRPLQLKELL